MLGYITYIELGWYLFLIIITLLIIAISIIEEKTGIQDKGFTFFIVFCPLFFMWTCYLILNYFLY